MTRNRIETASGYLPEIEIDPDAGEVILSGERAKHYLVKLSHDAKDRVHLFIHRNFETLPLAFRRDAVKGAARATQLIEEAKSDLDLSLSLLLLTQWFSKPQQSRDTESEGAEELPHSPRASSSCCSLPDPAKG